MSELSRQVARALRARQVQPDGWATDRASKAVMRANMRRDTAPEVAIRRLLHAAGLRYRVDYPALVSDRRRRADSAFTRKRIAVFVDGCFWHGCPQHFIAPRSC